MVTSNDITLKEVADLLRDAIRTIERAQQPDSDAAKEVIAKLNRMAATMDANQALVTAATQRMREAQALAVEFARVSCADLQRQETQSRMNDRKDEREFTTGIITGIVVVTMIGFFLGGFAFIGSRQPSSAHAAGLIGLAVCWTILVIAFLYVLCRKKN